MINNDLLDQVKPRVSVIIVSHNSAGYLGNCLDSILMNIDLQVELIVVDNASDDDSRSICKSLPNVTLIRNRENLGFSKAVNQGIRKAEGKYILLLNPDTVLPPNCLSEFANFMEENPRVGMIGPQLVRANGQIDLACRRNFPTHKDIILRLLAIDRLFPNSRFFNHYNATSTDLELEGYVECISGAFMFVRREAIENVGLLDETYFLYGEDVDWALRFIGANWRIYYYPRIKVLHYKRGSSNRITSLTIYSFYSSLQRYYETHIEPRSSFTINLLIRLTIWGRMVFAMLTWRITGRWL